MPLTVFILFCSLLFALAGCGKRETAQLSQSPGASPSPRSPTAQREWGEPRFDVCGLIAKEEVEEIQGTPIKEIRGTGALDGPLFISQCFYMTPEMGLSVVLSVTEKDPNQLVKRTPNDLWKELFSENADNGKARDERKAKGQPRRKPAERHVPPRKIEGMGDEAYWLGGALYILRKDVFLRIGAVGSNNEEAKLEKSKKLGEKALTRL